MRAKICDGCGKVFRQEGRECQPDEITFSHKIYHIGEGMQMPWKKIDGEFCTTECFMKWLKKEYKEWRDEMNDG